MRDFIEAPTKTAESCHSSRADGKFDPWSLSVIAVPLRRIFKPTHP
jgi:hypothetical protein